MNIIIVAPDEQRDRQKFVSRPLIDNGHIVFLVKTSPAFSFISKVLDLCFRDKPDAVIVIGGFGPKQLAVLELCKLSNIPVIVRMGGNRIRDLDSTASSLLKKKKFLSWLRVLLHSRIARIFFNRIDMAIVVNETLAWLFHNRSDVKVYVVPQYCEGDSHYRSYSLGEELILLTVANLNFLDKSKGMIWLIEQVATFSRKTNQRIRFLAAGSGLHLTDVEKFLDFTVIPGNLSVELLGYVTDIDKYYIDSDIMLYHSSHDATPNVILESKRFGLPILANACDEFKSIVDNNVSGLLYEDETDFQTHLCQLASCEELRKRLGENAIVDREKRFSFLAAKLNLEIAIQAMLAV